MINSDRQPALNVQQAWSPQIAQTPFCATAVAFSQHVPHLLAVGTGQNFGVAGKGAQHIYSASPFQPPTLRASYPCEQAVLDCRFSEASAYILGGCVGNDILLWDVRKGAAAPPIHVLKGHKRECHSLEWNTRLTNLLLTSSWDLSVRLTDVSTQMELLRLENVHQHAVYNATWCPSQPFIIGNSRVMQ